MILPVELEQPTNLTPNSFSSSETAHTFSPPTDAAASRSPCPALNTLANHHYISHDGKNVSYTVLVNAICTVYNVSRPLAHLLALVGYTTCGKLSFFSRSTYTHTDLSRSASSSGPTVTVETYGKAPYTSLSSRLLSFIPISWTLDLASLAQRGGHKIAHDASLVHPNSAPSHSPDPALVSDLVDYAAAAAGLSLRDLAHLHAMSLAKLDKPLDTYHEQIALGECGFFWLLMREGKEEKGDDDVVPIGRVKQWLGEERLPDGWTRPVRTVGLAEARLRANQVQNLMLGLKVAS